MGFFLLGIVAGAILAWPFMRRRDCYWREFNARRRGGSFGAHQPIFNEGHTQRGNGSGGPSTPKPEIKPQPQPGAERVYRGAMWREKGSDVWHYLGNESNWAEVARQQINQAPPPPKAP